MASRLKGLLPSRRAGLSGQVEALHIVRRLNREYPEISQNPVTNLSLLTVIKNLGLSYSQAVDLRWWLLDELTIKKTDLTKIPPMSSIFREAEASMVPEGMEVTEELASVGLQELLNHTMLGLLTSSDVCSKLQDGHRYRYKYHSLYSDTFLGLY